METLTNDNFSIYAAANYNNPRCLDAQEFWDDLLKFKYLKRLFKRYHDTGDLQERLILNHLIVLYNVFGIPVANKMIFFKIEKSCWSSLKTFLVFLNYLPTDIYENVPIDKTIVNKLRKI
jgi:hypothetical protein